MSQASTDWAYILRFLCALELRRYDGDLDIAGCKFARMPVPAGVGHGESRAIALDRFSAVLELTA